MRNSRGNVSLLLVDRVGTLKQRLSTVEDDGIGIMAEARNFKEALEELTRQSPDLVLLDVRKTSEELESFVRRLRKQHPGLRIVAYTHCVKRETLRSLVRSGVHGLLSAGLDGQTIVLAIRSVAGGALWFSADLTDSVMDLIRQTHEPAKKTRLQDDIGLALTQRENDVLNLIARGLTNEQIARQLNLGVETVKTHVRRIMDKTANRSRRELMNKVLSSKVGGTMARASVQPPRAR